MLPLAIVTDALIDIQRRWKAAIWHWHCGSAQAIRMVARAISGIGFLGAGTFIKWKESVDRIVLRPISCRINNRHLDASNMEIQGGRQ